MMEKDVKTLKNREDADEYNAVRDGLAGDFSENLEAPPDDALFLENPEHDFPDSLEENFAASDAADDDTAELADNDAIGAPRTEVLDVARYDPLRAYLAEIARFATLDREEERALAENYRRTGDKEVAYRLVTANLKLVVKIAMIYHKVYRNILDLIQEGNLGLLQAVQRFDPERGTRLQTYAAWWIKAYILKFLLDNTRMVRIGTTNARRKILMNLNREKRELEARGIAPSTKLLAENLGVDEQEIREVEQGMTGGDLSLDAPLGEDGDASYIDTLRLMEQSVDEKIAQGEFRELLEQKLTQFATRLTGRDQDILRRRLLAEEPETLQEIADRYGVTREAVRVAEKKLVARLKQYLLESFGDVREIEFNLSH